MLLRHATCTHDRASLARSKRTPFTLHCAPSEPLRPTEVHLREVVRSHRFANDPPHGRRDTKSCRAKSCRAVLALQLRLDTSQCTLRHLVPICTSTCASTQETQRYLLRCSMVCGAATLVLPRFPRR